MGKVTRQRIFVVPATRISPHSYAQKKSSPPSRKHLPTPSPPKQASQAQPPSLKVTLRTITQSLTLYNNPNEPDILLHGLTNFSQNHTTQFRFIIHRSPVLRSIIRNKTISTLYPRKRFTRKRSSRGVWWERYGRHRF